MRILDKGVVASAATTPATRTLVDVFGESVARYGELPALHTSEGALTYSALADDAAGVAAALTSQGIGPGDRIGIRVASGSAELYISILGVLMAGAAYVPVDADDPVERAEQIFAAAGVCATIADGLKVDLRAAPAGKGRALEPEDDAWIIFTSGSTGTPKGVAVSHRSAAAFVDAEALLWSVYPEDRILAGLSVAFDASCEEMWLAWRNGAALVPAPRALVRSGAELGPWLREQAVTVISTVPTLAAMWDESELADVRLLILGGEACPEALAWRLSAGREVWNTYGPTEATVVTTAAQMRPGDPVTIGWPLAGWQIAVVDEDNEPVSLGQTGELVIGGVGLGRYLDPALDAERFAAIEALGWKRAYRSGDIVRETVDGLQFVGRRDDQVKLGGRRIELGEIDSALLSAPGVRAAAAAVRRTASGNSVLVGYVTGEPDIAIAREHAARRLPDGIVPTIVRVDALPTTTSGKVDRSALPWPPPSAEAQTAGLAELSSTERWLAERWIEQLGPLELCAASDFFELGGSSLSVAKLVSVCRRRYPAFAVADVYRHRRLGELATRLEQLAAPADRAALPDAQSRRRWGAVQLGGLLCLKLFNAAQLLLGVLALNAIVQTTRGTALGPTIGLGWLAASWLVLASAPGRAAIVLLARRALLPRLEPGRYPRRGWLSCRIWFLERLADICRFHNLAGTPWAVRYARLSGARVGEGVRLKTLPPPVALIEIGDGATVESHTDLHGWWIDDHEIVVDRITIGSGARIGARSVLMPGAEVGSEAELEVGTVVTGRVPAGERWAGSPARRVGTAGHDWPDEQAPAVRRPHLMRAMYAGGLALQPLLPLLAGIPGLVILTLLTPNASSLHSVATAVLEFAPLLAATYMISFALVVAGLFRLASRLLRPGWQADGGTTAWALWFTEHLMVSALGVLFPIYSSIYTRSWLRLLGIRAGRRMEMSHAITLNRLTTMAELSFAADDAAFAVDRSRGGWLHVAPIEVGSRTFLGNSAILRGGTQLGGDSLVGVLSLAPQTSPDGTSWFGTPPLELPRVPDPADPARTISPPARLVVARGAVELFRILFPSTASVAIGTIVFVAVERAGHAAGVAAMLLAAPAALIAGGICATLLTIAAKWIFIGRYRPGQHPLWSSFVWRDEIINSAQEMLSAAWLMRAALGTPLTSLYLRAMGARVGRDVWCETLNVTEFEMVDLRDGCAINRSVHIETHLFHDRLMRIGPTSVGKRATLGPQTAVLPDTVVGDGCRVGARSVLLRGEELPPGTRWDGAPLVGV